jgi:hypothetical protein
MAQHLAPHIFQRVLRQAASVQPVKLLVHQLRLELSLHLFAYLALSQSSQFIVLTHYSFAGCKMSGQITSAIRSTCSQGDAN